MAKIQIHRNRTKPTVVCEMPSALAACKDATGGNAYWYAHKSVATAHCNTGHAYSTEFTLTGIFKDETSGEITNLLKATQVVFDLDLVDVCMYGSVPNAGRLFPIMMARAKEFFNTNNIAIVYGTSMPKSQSSGSPYNVSNASEDLETFEEKKAINAAVMKAYLCSLSEAELKIMVGEVVEQHVKFVSSLLGGKLPTIITYSGTGYHMHYHLDDRDGWTADGVAVAIGTDEMLCNINEMKENYKKLNGAFNEKFGYMMDKALSQIGTAATRDIGSINDKHSGNHKTVAVLTPVDKDGKALSDISSRLRGADFNVPESASSANFQAKVNAARPGRPKKFVPKRIAADAEITLEVRGVLTPTTAEMLWEEWDNLFATSGGVVESDGKQKIKCRLDWVSNGSINAWCRLDPNNRDAGIMFILNVSKYSSVDPEAWHTDANGNTVGTWVYAGGYLSQLQRNDKGVALNNTHNQQIILTQEPRLAGKIRFNSRTNNVEVRGDLIASQHSAGNYRFGSLSSHSWMLLSDNTVEFINYILEQTLGSRANFDGLIRIIGMTARMFNSVDPAQEWIQSVQWDGVNRLDTWLPELLQMPTTHERYEAYAAYGRTAMLSIARLSFATEGNPVRINHMLVLHGHQAAGKSTLARTIAAVSYLGESYYSESELQFDRPADLALQLQGRMVAEVPEMNAFSKSDITSIKSFLTKGQEVQRTAYQRNAQTFQNTAFLIGTTNHRHMLNDSTGNRRFMMVDFDDSGLNGKRWNLSKLESELPQMYSEAYHRAVLGQGIPASRATHKIRYNGCFVEEWSLSVAEHAIQAEVNTAFETSTPEQDALLELLSDFVRSGKTKGVKLMDIAQQLKARYDVVIKSNNIVSQMLQNAGWTRYKSNGAALWKFESDDNDPKPTNDPHKETRREAPTEAPDFDAAPKSETKSVPKTAAKALKNITPGVKNFTGLSDDNLFERTLNGEFSHLDDRLGYFVNNIKTADASQKATLLETLRNYLTAKYVKTAATV